MWLFYKYNNRFNGFHFKILVQWLAAKIFSERMLLAFVLIVNKYVKIDI